MATPSKRPPLNNTKLPQTRPAPKPPRSTRIERAVSSAKTRIKGAI